MTEIFLMGTAGESLWREPIKAACDAAGVTYFDPRVKVWNDEAKQRETKALSEAKVVVMAITGETASVASLAESGWAALSALRRGQAFGLYVDPDVKDQSSGKLTGWLVDTFLGGRERADEMETASERARLLVLSHARKLEHQFPQIEFHVAETLADLEEWVIRTAKKRQPPQIKQSSHPRDAAIAAFKEQFQTTPQFISRAPGRVNVIGEHTDYNDGFVMPAAIDRAIYVAGSVRQDEQISLHSLDFESATTFTFARLHDDTLPTWTKYIRGALSLMGTLALMHGRNPNRLNGMNLVLAGDVPLGAGFSSSAAVEVAIFEMLAALMGISLTQTQKALLGQQVEHQFIGIRSGIMDQLISAVGLKDHALLIDCRSLESTPVPLPKGTTLVTLDTGKRRELVTSEYGLRREQCETAARIMGVGSLRDATLEMLAKFRDQMPEVVAKRAQHVLEENTRTLAAVEAMRQGDAVTLGKLINQSHTSLSKLYEVSIAELDIMAELAQAQAGVYGARMMGGGFGGAVIALVEDAKADAVIETVCREYQARTGLIATPFKAKAGAGSSVERLN
ncbi:MAG: hypothetical protein OHK0023_19140 [Anaerolineae bacterium]